MERQIKLHEDHRANECFVTHLIEEDGTLNVVECDNFLKEVNLAACGLEYAVVSIMGPQSSGKSTLLNHLFGTTFKEMDESKRSKTTAGIWLARAAGIKPCTLVMDVEGSDGQERGEDDTSFQMRSGLFALAVSHVVLINMFYTSVGLEHGASTPLLKAVFQGTLRLFTPRKTTLMFVLRDLVLRTPLENLEPVLRNSIQKIWDSIPKPKDRMSTPMSTFFNVEVVSLPNYKEREEEFKDQVKILRQRFIRSIVPGGLAGDNRDTICGSDFSLSVQKIWKTIKEDKELDLPKHMVMVATIRCEEIADKKLEAFKVFVANEESQWWYQLQKGAQYPTTGFGKKLSSKIKSCLDEYEDETAYYDGGVRSEKKKHFEEKLVQSVQSALQPILARIASRTLDESMEAFDEAIKKGKKFERASKDCVEACMKSFDAGCPDVTVDQANCDTSRERENLQLYITAYILYKYLTASKEKAAAAKLAVEFLGGLTAGGIVGLAVFCTFATSGTTALAAVGTTAIGVTAAPLLEATVWVAAESYKNIQKAYNKLFNRNQPATNKSKENNSSTEFDPLRMRSKG